MVSLVKEMKNKKPVREETYQKTGDEESGEI